MNSSESDLIYSAKVAYQAARFYRWRRFCTTFGLLYLGSLVICIGMMVFAYTYEGTNWFFGFMGTMLGFNLILQTATWFSLPKATAKVVSNLKSPNGHIALDDEGFTLSVGGNVVKILWSRFRYVWPRKDFIVLARPYFGMLHIPTEGMTANVRAEFERRGLGAVVA